MSNDPTASINGEAPKGKGMPKGCDKGKGKSKGQEPNSPGMPYWMQRGEFIARGGSRSDWDKRQRKRQAYSAARRGVHTRDARRLECSVGQAKKALAVAKKPAREAQEELA